MHIMINGQRVLSAYLLFIKVHVAETQHYAINENLMYLKRNLSLQLSLIAKIFILIMNKKSCIVSYWKNFIYVLKKVNKEISKNFR